MSFTGYLNPLTGSPTGQKMMLASSTDHMTRCLWTINQAVHAWTVMIVKPTAFGETVQLICLCTGKQLRLKSFPVLHAFVEHACMEQQPRCQLDKLPAEKALRGGSCRYSNYFVPYIFMLLEYENVIHMQVPCLQNNLDSHINKNYDCISFRANASQTISWIAINTVVVVQWKPRLVWCWPSSMC